MILQEGFLKKEVEKCFYYTASIQTFFKNNVILNNGFISANRILDLNFSQPHQTRDGRW